MHTTVETLSLIHLIFYNKAHLQKAGSVSQSIGNVLWLKPLSPSWLQPRFRPFLVVW